MFFLHYKIDVGTLITNDHNHNTYELVIRYYINGLPRSEISALTGISTGAISNIIKNWKEKAAKIPDIDKIRGFMKQVYKTGITPKECAQGSKMVQMIGSFYNEENEVQDADIPTLFWSFINDIYTPCIKMGIPPSYIPGWMNDLFTFFSHPNRLDDITFSSNSRNEKDKQLNSIVSTKPIPKPKAILPASQLAYPYDTEKPEIAEKSRAKKEIPEYGNDAPGQSCSAKLIGQLNMTFIWKISSYIDTEKKKCMKLEERNKVLLNTDNKLRSQIDRSRALRDYVVKEEQSIMKMYNWYHELKNSLMENYNIAIEDVHEFARVIHEFSKSGYDSNYILKEFLEIKSMKLEKKVLGDEIKLLKDNKRSLESTLKFYDSRIEESRETMNIYHQLEKMGFGLDMLKQLKDTLLEIARAKKQSNKEVPKEFLNDIHRYYY